jgi:cation transport ATPase
MINQELINYIKTEEAQGYTPQQLSDYLIQQGYSAQEVDEAMKYANQQQTNNAENSVDKKIKRRNPFLIILFSFITFGIYSIFWLVFTTKELKKRTQFAPNPWLILLMFIPLVNFIIMLIYFWKYSKAINELTGFNSAALFLLWILISPVGMIISQIELNKKAE